MEGLGFLAAIGSVIVFIVFCVAWSRYWKSTSLIIEIGNRILKKMKEEEKQQKKELPELKK